MFYTYLGIGPMTDVQTQDYVYRFAAFAARGEVTLRSDCVSVKTRTHLGWWEQTIPLSELRPNYGTLAVVPPLLLWIFVFALASIAGGIYGWIWSDRTFPTIAVHTFLLAGGLAIVLYAVRNYKTEWIIFNAYDPNLRVGYTRQGPDSNLCDEFTERLVNAIRSTRRESSA
jgi:hypothetical protein